MESSTNVKTFGLPTRLIAVFLAVVAVAAIAGAIIYNSFFDTLSSEPVSAATTLSTSVVERRDLVEYGSLSGNLGYELTAISAAPMNGTITYLTGEGSVLTRGDVIYEVNDQPAVLFYGEQAAWRPLSQESEPGLDIRQLEENLIILGYDPERAITLDDTYDEATAAAVELWERDMGLTPDGIVDNGQVVFMPGAVQVGNHETLLGAAIRAESPVLNLIAMNRVTTVEANQSGLLTSIVDQDAALLPGDILYETYSLTSELPVLYGSSSLVRTLDISTEAGEDVRILEAFLVASGYDPDRAIDIDGIFDSSTAEAVAAWETDLGLAADGVVSVGSAIIIPNGLTNIPFVYGSVPLSRELSMDTEPGADVRELEEFLVAFGYDPNGAIDVDETYTDATAEAVAVWEAELGQEVDGIVQVGQYLVVSLEGPFVKTTAIPVIAGNVPLTRQLWSYSTAGEDVRILEENLVAMGFDSQGQVVVDTIYDDATTEAVRLWEETLGIEPDGIVQSDQYLVVPPSMTVDDILVDTGSVVRPGDLIVELTAPNHIVTTQLSISDLDSLSIGQEVVVELPGGEQLPGVVENVGTVVQVDQAQQQEESSPFVFVRIGVDGLPENFALTETPVEIQTVDELVASALAVPVSALLALNEGGFAVEVVDGSGNYLVAVDPGMYANGWVEVRTDGLSEGMEVVVP